MVSLYFHKLVCYNITQSMFSHKKGAAMSKFYDKPSSDLLYQAMLELHSVEECREFCRTCAPYQN